MAGESQQELLAKLQRPKYNAALNTAFQQSRCVTEGLVTEDTEAGASMKSDDFLGIGQMREKQTTGAPLKRSTIDNQTRWTTSKDYYDKITIDRSDRIKLINGTEHGSAYAGEQAKAGHRIRDKVVIDAALGTVYTGKTPTTPVTLPASQVIAASASGMTYAKHLEAVQRLRTRGAWDPNSGDRIIGLWTSKEETAFIQQLQVGSRDYSTNMPNDKGYLPHYGPVDFYAIEDVYDPLDLTAAVLLRMLPFAAGERTVIYYVKKALKRWQNDPINGDVNWLPEEDAWLVSTRMSVGGSRQRDAGVVAIQCTSTG